MRNNKVKALISLILSLISVIFAGPQIVTAERLPVREYTMADGLAQNAINRIVPDSRGFLWFCTEDGLSRYDGYTFTNYGHDQGLPSGEVRDLLETRAGDYLVGSFSGLYRFNPRGRAAPFIPGTSQPNENNNQQSSNGGQATDDLMFVLCHASEHSSTAPVNKLLEDRTGAVWGATGDGLYRLEQRDGKWALRYVEIGLQRNVDNDMRVRALAEDKQGSLWIGAGSGLYRRRPDGLTERYTMKHGLPGNEVRTLLVDAQGQLWVGMREGLSQIALEARTSEPRIVRVYTSKNGLPNSNTRSIFQSSTGQLWVGSSTALVELVPQANPNGSQLPSYSSELGLSKLFVQTIAEDRDGNLWIGTDNGALKLARNGFTTYTEADGLGESRVSSVFESRAGDLGLMTIFSSENPISFFEGKRFRAIRPKVPASLTYFGWGWHQLTLQDREGEWWLPTGQGLVRYPSANHVSQLATTQPKAIYTTKHGLVSNDVVRLYEDSRSDIWISTFSESGGGLSRWERATETFRHYGELDGLPKGTTPLAFREDREGNLWIGFYGGQSLARLSKDRLRLFTSQQGLPEGDISNIYLDRTGRLWIASSRGGLARLDDTNAERPQFTVYTTSQGLSSDGINCITEDEYGRLYIGTGRGLDRLDPSTGRVKTFTVADGLISGEVLVSFCDRKGELWFGGKGGLSRLSPQPDPPESPPPVLITGLRIGGEAHQISALGETEIATVELGPDKNQIQIDFVALGFSPGAGLRYQYKLIGSGADWTPLSDQRTVNFARLAPGRYRFEVRAVNADGVMSAAPAGFAFTILPPMWQRWWFVMVVTLIVGLIAYNLYRYRVRRLVELERVRTRIASDLHDDIGANLTKIGILSEVVHQQINGQDRRMAEPLTSIAYISRESVASMSDIVWAINPKKDTLRDLTRRMREFAGDIFANRDIEFELRAPAPEMYLKLSADVRRTIFLIFKEAVNNLVRHSECKKADIELRVEGQMLMLRVTDDGRGFDITREATGNGLASMRNRAVSMGGELRIGSRAPSGTLVTLRLPIKQGKLSIAKRDKASS